MIREEERRSLTHYVVADLTIARRIRAVIICFRLLGIVRCYALTGFAQLLTTSAATLRLLCIIGPHSIRTRRRDASAVSS
jgi:hypothetical protein